MNDLVDSGGIGAMPDGVYTDLTHDAYLALDRFSANGAKKLLRSPAHFLCDRTMHHAATAAMQFGTATHMGVLEPQRFDESVLCVPDDAPTRPSSRQVNAKKPSPATIEAVEWWSAFNKRAAGKLLFNADDIHHLNHVVEAIRSHPGAMRLLEGNVAGVGQREVSILWTDPDFDVQCKMRADYLRSDGGVVDIKTALDASPEEFPKAAARLLYHVQAAIYLAGVEAVTGRVPPFFAIIAAEKEPPYAVASYVMPSNAILAGRRLAHLAMGAYKRALETGDWSSYPTTIEPLDFPKWATSFATN